MSVACDGCGNTQVAADRDKKWSRLIVLPTGLLPYSESAPALDLCPDCAGHIRDTLAAWRKTHAGE